MTDEEKRIEGLAIRLIGVRAVLESEFFWTGKRYMPFKIETGDYKTRKAELLAAII